MLYMYHTNMKKKTNKKNEEMVSNIRQTETVTLPIHTKLSRSRLLLAAQLPSKPDFINTNFDVIFFAKSKLILLSREH